VVEKPHKKGIASMNFEEIVDINPNQSITKTYESYLKASDRFLFSGITDHEKSQRADVNDQGKHSKKVKVNQKLSKENVTEHLAKRRL